MDEVFKNFIMLALLPVLLTGISVEANHVYRNMKAKLRDQKKYIPFFWWDWFMWYTMLLFLVMWIIVWTYGA